MPPQNPSNPLDESTANPAPAASQTAASVLAAAKEEPWGAPSTGNWADDKPDAAAAAPASVATTVKTAPASAASASAADSKDATPSPAVNNVTDQLANTVVSGLDPSDATAEIEVQGVDSDYKAAESFDQLGLPQTVMDGITQMGWIHPSKIQAAVLSVVLARDAQGRIKPRNIIAQAKNGSGKTGAYSLSMICCTDHNVKEPQVICVTPMRELAVQVHEVVTSLSKHTNVTAFLAVPGCPRGKITDQIIVGTPGTLINTIKYKRYNPKKIRMLVLDEADEQLSKDNGLSALKKIKKPLGQVQVLLFSATFSPRVLRFAGEWAPNAAQFIKKRDTLEVSSVTQFWVNVGSDQNRYAFLKMIYALLNIGQSIIFVNTRQTAKDLCRDLRKDDFAVSLLHGKDMPNEERDRVMKEFRTGKTTVLIASNLIARGIDVPAVTMVVNYDIPVGRRGTTDPDSCDTYLHRIGRAGRFGNRGAGINFVYNNSTMASVRFIEKFFDVKMKELPFDNFAEVKKQVEDALKKKK